MVLITLFEPFYSSNLWCQYTKRHHTTRTTPRVYSITCMYSKYERVVQDFHGATAPPVGVMNIPGGAPRRRHSRYKAKEGFFSTRLRNSILIVLTDSIILFYGIW